RAAPAGPSRLCVVAGGGETRPLPPSGGAWRETQRATSRPAGSKPGAAGASPKGRGPDMRETPERGGRGERPGGGRGGPRVWARTAERPPARRTPTSPYRSFSAKDPCRLHQLPSISRKRPRRSPAFVVPAAQPSRPAPDTVGHAARGPAGTGDPAEHRQRRPA